MLKRIEPQVHVCASVPSVGEAVEAIRKMNPALVFLDIEMPEESGFSLFEKLGDIVNFETIFTTAYSSYAIEAFKVNALGYLLKPFEPQELQRAVQKVLTLITKPSTSSGHQNFQKNNIKDDLSQYADGNIGHSRHNKLMVTSTDGVRFFPLNEIIRLEADGAYTRIFFKTLPPFLSSKNLGEYEQKLSAHGIFIRVHRSVIINADEVIQFSSDGITMSDHALVNVSRHNRGEFLDRMKISRLKRSHNGLVLG
jgi:two-component system LytT family response regulator